MSMKRILGLMLASRMAGRGRRGGITGGGLGGVAAAGMLGGRRGGLGRKAGLAALGYMAYRAYQDRQAGTAGATDTSRSRTSETGEAGGGGLSGLLKSASDALTGSRDRDAARHQGGTGAETAGAPDAAFTPEARQAAETFSEDTALLLVRAMVTAANADGSVSPEERERIMAQAEEANADPQDRDMLEREIANPKPLEALLVQVRDQGIAEEFYLASRMAVDDTTEANRTYLLRLRERLGLGDQEAAEIDSLAT